MAANSKNAEHARQLAHLHVPVHAYDSVGSTMETAHALAQQGAVDGTLVWAARQTAGRGRLGREWVSPEGGVYFSIIARPSRPSAEIPQLSLVAGLAAAESIRQLTGLSGAIRWPNDLLINGKKVCGILVESKTAVVIGIGINVSADPANLPETATSLNAAGAACDPYALTRAVYERFQHWYAAWGREGFAPVRDALRSWIGLFGRPVSITAGSSRFEGTAADLDESGRLLVRLDAGLLRPFEMGEVTLLR